MNKIIRYVGNFSETFKQGFEKLRGAKKVLSSKQAIDIKSIDEITENVIDYDNITIDLVYLILDYLEQIKLHKLAIFVCNRYKLADKLGRCLTNVACNYSCIATESAALNSLHFFRPKHQWIMKEKAYVANKAFHNILEIINPVYIKLKKKGEAVSFDNHLGDQCFTQLIFLGYWKKCLFLMDYNTSLEVAQVFSSFSNYKLIMLTGNPKYEALLKENEDITVFTENSFEKLPFASFPSSQEETDYALICLEQALWNIHDKYPVFLHHSTRSTFKGNVQKNLKQDIFDVSNFPIYFDHNQTLWEFVLHQKHETQDALTDRLENALDVIHRALINDCGPNKNIARLEIFDTASFLT
mmetsp:Transcript_28177/g.24957  ORF Transcript_28177/g.24957 Transcript_28177/m.24957 type:complete len:355 (+) Transcript_28177:4728-5792(+)